MHKVCIAIISIEDKYSVSLVLKNLSYLPDKIYDLPMQPKEYHLLLILFLICSKD